MTWQTTRGLAEMNCQGGGPPNVSNLKFTEGGRVRIGGLMLPVCVCLCLTLKDLKERRSEDPLPLQTPVVVSARGGNLLDFHGFWKPNALTIFSLLRIPCQAKGCLHRLACSSRASQLGYSSTNGG